MLTNRQTNNCCQGVNKSKSQFLLKIVGDQNHDIVPVGRFFVHFERFLQATFKLHIQCPCNKNDTRLLNNSDHYLALREKKHIIVYFSD